MRGRVRCKLSSTFCVYKQATPRLPCTIDELQGRKYSRISFEQSTVRRQLTPSFGSSPDKYSRPDAALRQRDRPSRLQLKPSQLAYLASPLRHLRVWKIEASFTVLATISTKLREAVTGKNTYLVVTATRGRTSSPAYKRNETTFSPPCCFGWTRVSWTYHKKKHL